MIGLSGQVAGEFAVHLGDVSATDLFTVPTGIFDELSDPRKARQQWLIQSTAHGTDSREPYRTIVAAGRWTLGWRCAWSQDGSG
jgi:hypothetical protein